MSHVDEGLLHAYLDGAFAPGDAQVDEIEAHIASCADCRARLEDARALKDRACEVLRHAAPLDLHVPPFETLNTRKHGAPHPGLAARTAASRPAAARRLARAPVRLAWAASLVLAIGAGWMANEMARRDPTRFEATQDAVTPARAPEAATSDALAATGEARAQDGTVPSARVDSPQPPVPATRTQASATDETMAIARGAENLPDRDVEPRANRVQMEALAIDTAEPLGADTANPLYRRMRQAAGVATDRLAPVPEPAAAAAADATDAGTRRTAYQPTDVIVLDTMPPTLSDGRVYAEHVELLNDYAAAVGGRLWSSATIEHATAALGREPATIEGRPPAATETAVVDGRVLVSLRYTLDGNVTLEILQRPAAPRPRAETTMLRNAELPPTGVPVKDLGESNPTLRGESLVAVSRPGLVLLLKGQMAHRALHAIAARIE